MAAYYNEIDLYAAEWLRNLIKAGHIADGEVDTRSIVDVKPDDLRKFDQCHFFAGIAGWSYALRLAGWADDRKIWTGSCPCQPFSVAGQGKGTDDPRHLWPHFFRLISACRPPVVMGEQVAGAAGYGWLDGVRSDLESEDYSCEGVDIPACSVNSPHIRQRLYWVAKDLADTERRGCESGSITITNAPTIFSPQDGICSGTFNMVNSDSAGQREYSRSIPIYPEQPSVECAGGDAFDMADADGEQLRRRHSREFIGAKSGDEREAQERERIWSDFGADGDNISSNMADTKISGWRQGTADSGRMSEGNRTEGEVGRLAEHSRSFWSDAELLTGADGKARRAQPGVRLLANGVPARVGKLRAYGNAIVPQVAAEVIKAFMEIE